MMNKIIDIGLCLLEIIIWIIADILGLLGLRSISNKLEHFIASLVNKNHKRKGGR